MRRAPLILFSLMTLLPICGLLPACESEHPPRIGVMPMGDTFAIHYNVCRETERITGVALVDTAGTLNVRQDDTVLWAISSPGSLARGFVVGEAPPDLADPGALRPIAVDPDALLAVTVRSKSLPQGETMYFRPSELREGQVMVSTVPGRHRYYSEAEFERLEGCG